MSEHERRERRADDGASRERTPEEVRENPDIFHGQVTNDFREAMNVTVERGATTVPPPPPDPGPGPTPPTPGPDPTPPQPTPPGGKILHFSEDFESAGPGVLGSQGPFVTYPLDADAISGDRVCRLHVPARAGGGGVAFLKYQHKGQPALTTEGVYQRWHMRMDAATHAVLSRIQIKHLMNKGTRRNSEWAIVMTGGLSGWNWLPNEVRMVVDRGGCWDGNVCKIRDFHFQPGVWTEFQTHYLYDPALGGGWVTFWIDGVKKFEVFEKKVGTADPLSDMWFKLGIVFAAGNANVPLTIDVDDVASANYDLRGT